MITRVLFVCLGNICRSPTAEGIFRHQLQQYGLEHRFEVDSAGTGAYHEGSAPDSRARQALKPEGVDISGLRARQVRDEDFYHFDYIMAADHQNLRDLEARKPHDATAQLSLFLSWASNAGDDEIPDPYYGGAAGFQHVITLCKEASEAFIRTLMEREPS